VLNQGNKILVRLEDQNQEPDWYRLLSADPAVLTRPGQYLDVIVTPREDAA
jgi:hypothetical protein